MPWNEVSRRYVDEEPEFYLPSEWRAKAANVKQGSSTDIIDIPNNHIKTITEINLQTYRKLLSDGVCAEQARGVLPLWTHTEWWWSGTLGAFLDMLKLRLDPHTQKETREVAEMISEKVKELFPVSYKAYLDEE